MDTSSATPPAAFFGRLTWMILGPVALLLLAWTIAADWDGWVTAADVIFLAILGLVPLARWAEFRTGRGQTAYGEPVTAADVRRYTAVTAAVGLTVWVAANLAGSLRSG
jgi:hypothetical protein